MDLGIIRQVVTVEGCGEASNSGVLVSTRYLTCAHILFSGTPAFIVYFFDFPML